MKQQLKTHVTNQMWVLFILFTVIWLVPLPSKGGNELVKPTDNFLSKEQSKIIKGSVTDVTNQPLPGVTVVIKGTTQGTVTDIDGKFTLSIPDNAETLQFSFVGMKTKDVFVDNRIEFVVIMEEESIGVDEVVVVGYGTQKRTSITGSVANISSKELLKAPVGNVSTLLGGRLPGLVTKQSSGLPGYDDASLLVRGRSTFGNSSPTVIVDGVQRSFNNLDPNEIETITILKDASAAAVYGVQGANGVILVTTKKGIQQKSEISFNSSFSMSENTRFPEFMDGPQYAYYFNKARELDELPIRFTESDFDKITNGDPDGILGNTNWVNKLFNNDSPTWHHNLSVRGGSKKINYFISAALFDQQGSVKGFNFKRYNLRSNIVANITADFKISLNLAGRLEERDRSFFGIGKNDWNSLIQQAIRAHPYVPMYAPNGDPVATRTASAIVSPISSRDHAGWNKNEMSVFQSNLSLSYKLPFIEGVTISAMASYDRDYTYSKIFNTPYKVQVVDPVSFSFQEQWAPNSSSGIAALTEGFGHANRLTLQPSITFNRVFDEKHKIDILVLYEQSSRLYNGFNASKRGFDFLDLPEFNFSQPVDIEKEYTIPRVGGSSNESPRAGFVSRLNYSFINKYLFEFASRYDGSYRFHKDHRWGFFPAISAGWIISEENFFKNVFPFVSHMKIRGSIGKLGNDQIGEYLYLSNMAVASNAVVIGGELQNALYTGSIPNKEITWETTTTYNGGLEAHFWNRLLMIEFDWFYKKTKDILQNVSGVYPPSMGGNFPAIVNSGIVDNRGFDLSISHYNKINKFDYSSRFNINWSRNKIIKIDDSPNIPDYIKRTGRPIGEKHGLIALGLFKTDEEALLASTIAPGAKAGDIKYKDLNGDGKIDYDQDRTWVGKSNIPELMFGLDLFASFKGFDFSALIQGAAIADLALMGFYPGIGYDNTEFTRTFYHGGNSPVYLVEDSWTPDNPNAKYPRLSTMSRANNNWSSTYWIKDASYLRLKNLQIGYTLPDILLQKYGIKSFRIFLGGSNLLTISEFKYLDPEAPDVANGYYPQQKNYTVGVNLTI